MGGHFLWQSRAIARATARGERSTLLISNGMLGWGAPRDVGRIHVFHGTMPAAMWASRPLLLRDRLRGAVGGGTAEYLAGRGATTVAVSRATAEEVERIYRITVDQVVENAVDTDLFRPHDPIAARRRFPQLPDGPIALFVGSAGARKGIDLAVAAAKEAGFVLAVAGDRPVRSAVHLGLLAPEDLAWAYSAADCVIFPTRYEACSFVVLEALAAQVPLVTTPVGWARELAAHVPGYAPLLTKPAVAPIVEALRYCLATDLTDVVTAARRHVVAQNSLEPFARRWRALSAEAANT